MSPYYEGDYFLITVDTVRDMQVKHGLISEDDEELKRDGANRILLTVERLPHSIVAIHMQNEHVGYAKDLEVLEVPDNWPNESRPQRIMYAYRNLCLHCQRYPHILRQSLHKILMGRKPRTVFIMDYLFVSKEPGHLLGVVNTFSRKNFIKHTRSETSHL